MDGLITLTAQQIDLKTRSSPIRAAELKTLPVIPPTLKKRRKPKKPKQSKPKEPEDFKLPSGLSGDGVMYRSTSLPRIRRAKVTCKPPVPKQRVKRAISNPMRTPTPRRSRKTLPTLDHDLPLVEDVPVPRTTPDRPPRRLLKPLRRPAWKSTDTLAEGGACVGHWEAVRWYERDPADTGSASAPATRVQLFDFVASRSTADPARVLKQRAKFLEASGLEPGTKLFTLMGPYEDLRAALRRRGWVECPEARETLASDLIVAVKSGLIAPDSLPPTVMHNHYAGSTGLTTKAGLCRNIRDLPWYEPADHRAFFPLSFDLGASGDVAMFKRAQAVFGALSILEAALVKAVAPAAVAAAKAVLHQMSWERHNRSPSGGKEVPMAIPADWAEVAGFVSRKLPAAPSTLSADEAGDVRSLLVGYRAIDPAAVLTVGQNAWVCKPAGKSRGRGILCLDTLAGILALAGSETEHYVVQKYIERPLLIHNRKFDCRVWCLVTSVSPFTVWVYDDYYLRFCCEDFSMDDLANTYVHLANNSVQKNSTNFDNIVPPDADHLCPTDGRPLKKTERANNMWASASFAEYIARTYGPGAYDAMMAAMRVALVDTLIVGQNTLVPRRRSYELFGVDVVFDTELKPWVLEVNSSPTLEHSSYVTARLVPAAMEGLVSILLDLDRVKTLPKAKHGWAHGGLGLGAGEGGLPSTLGAWRLVYRGMNPGRVSDGCGLELRGANVDPPPRFDRPFH
ncbi:Tubulin-tyrosine ligase/Tubulin polyglutamylase [Carpediemonas membranifera]|uniref:Tubulin-tyrosine ligase/Tubulin polyglutamylase n=1 Tax=Carpediemonas membranifera TaxID=201153 RepID=A0A8J6BB38_9EUKA|nr:Tubulin-tyrosine ligase/Tubulin polyglutamylase [Carpediemonas membranifera]|eukprot:KAG9396572.1 Tubulin-tyrosine ligase/Tubulin polyglutamylase [Carpediemonas membranifera]